MLKILQIIPSINPVLGGVSQAVLNMAEGLKDACNNTILTLDNPNEEYVKKQTHNIIALGKGKTAWSYHPNINPWLIKHIHEFDAVIVHGLWQYQSYAVYKSIIKTKFKGKLFVMPHGMLSAYFENFKRRGFKVIRNKVIWYLSDRKIINSCHSVLYTCEQEMLLAKSVFKSYNPKSCTVVSLGVPHKKSKAVKNSLLQQLLLTEKSTVLFLGRLHPIKGIHHLVSAFKRFNNSKYRSNIQLIIAGPVNSNYGEALVESISSSENIHYVGMLNNDDKWFALNNCNVLAAPSHYESFGVSIVEALACKKPVLISDQVNIWKEIEAGGGGIIAPDTTDGTYRALEKWLEMTDEAKHEMALNAKEVYLKNFTIDIAAKKLKNALEN